MFDFIKCDYPLPLPEEALELKPLSEWQETEFQTKSLHSTLDVYTIEEDGQMYKELVKRKISSDGKGTLTMDETPDGIEKVELTGEIDFYTICMEAEYDYWVEFKALFWKGDLKEMLLKDFKKEDNSKRLEAQSSLEAALAKHDERIEKNSRFLRQKFIALVRILMFLIRWPIGKIAQLTWKIERWIT